VNKPRIGVTCADPAKIRKYVTALVEAGAEPVLIPVGTPDAVALLDRVDAMLFPGGPDIDPKEYGEPLKPGTEVNPELDALELPLARQALRRRMPVLAICRGQQLINVALGGSLHQDLQGDRVTDLNHRTPRDQPRDLLSDDVSVEAGSTWGSLLDSAKLRVNSHHHQAVKEVAPGLKVTAVSADGVIEGLESEDGTVLAVQCHPEELTAYPWAQALFRHFAKKAAAAAGTKSGIPS
jgi:putative glutamine amidotransferase